MDNFTDGSGHYRAEGTRKSNYREMDSSVDMLIHNRGDSLVPRDPRQPSLYETTGSRQLGAWKEHYRSTKKTLSDLETFFLQRAQLEEEFSQRLLGLARQKLGEGESGNLASSLNSVKKEVEASAAAHLQLASRIREDLLQPSSQQATQVASSKRGLLTALLPKKQAQSNHLFLLERSKERLQEARQAGGDSTRFGVEQELQLAAARYEDASHHLQAEEERALRWIQAARNESYSIYPKHPLEIYQSPFRNMCY
ncbi:formin-binding protein [Entomophthora muscae]|uniref:Formin-binding protein n=1 Tax=Entomophthora muscae TaxID=34485 RepID=A0ACC2UL22_9FUNG|nr:formin-binding protein [Entomophthora muscae]